MCIFLASTGEMHTERSSKILIIDDDPVDRELYKRCLQQSQVWEFEFAEADCAAIGIQMLESWQPDCILLDFNLPDMDGIEALAKLHDETGRAPCPVVMLTAFGDEALAVKTMKAGATDYLPKGRVSAETLRQTAINAMERFAMQQRIAAQRFALEESGRRYQVLLEAIPEMVWTANAEGRVQYANNRWFEYCGITLDEAARLGWDQLLHPDDRERSFDAWEVAAKSGSVLEIEHRLRRASDGGYRWHLVRAVPMRSGDEPTTWFGTCTDIEDQKQAERELLQKQKQEGIGTLAGGVAHDFNNLLVIIMGGASYAQESLPVDHPVQPMLSGVVLASQRAAELTRKMLTYAGKGAFYLKLTDLDWLVRDTCAALRTSIPKTIRLELQSQRALPPVHTDAEQLRQVVVDLVMNAVEAIAEGSPGTISVNTSSLEISQEAARQTEFAAAGIAPGRYVALEVRDTGCGMDEDTQKKAFDPFFSTKFTGRGLGLAAVYGFVRSSGGGVQVDSARGHGARFRILLPAAPGKEMADVATG
ncbi:MAG TPA: response regulator [Candidatus Acidoferrales bacterium]|jgi:PAS domain S-box-containing protein|nr:response regulator [Candidatus Acidoferrales bacterium]